MCFMLVKSYQRGIKMKIKIVIMTAFIVLPLTIHVMAADYSTECKKQNLSACNQWISTTPNSSEAYFYRAVTKASNNDTTGAMEDYDQAIILNPDDFTYYFNRADLKAFFEDYEGAYNDLNKALKLNPGNTDIVKKREEARKKAGIAEISVKTSTQLTQKASKTDNINFKSGESLQMLIQQCNNNQLESCNKWIQIEPDNEVAYYTRGNIKNKSGDKKGALDDYQKAVDIKPNFQKASNKRNEIGLSKEFRKEIVKYDNNAPNIKQYEKDCKNLNLNSCDSWIEEQPYNAKAYYTRANTKRKLKDLRGALKDYNKTLDLDNKYTKAACWRAWLEGFLRKENK